MAFILSDDPSAVVQHHMQGSRIVQVDPQVDLLLWNDAVCFLQGQAQPFRSVALSPEGFGDEIADMPGSGP